MSDNLQEKAIAKPDWWYDEFRHFAVDFDDPQQVAAYDARQGTKLDGERQLVKRLGIRAGQRVIEFGTGTGAFAQAAAESGAVVTAVDISSAMLAYGKSRTEAAGLNAKFVHGGFLSYQHIGAPVDFVVTKYAFHHLPDFWKGVALRQFAAMLKSGGQLYLEDVIFSFESDAVGTNIEAWITQVVDGESFSRADFAGHVRDEFSTYGWILEGLMERSGFEIIERNYSSPTYANYLCRKSR